MRYLQVLPFLLFLLGQVGMLFFISVSFHPISKRSVHLPDTSHLLFQRDMQVYPVTFALSETKFGRAKKILNGDFSSKNNASLFNGKTYGLTTESAYYDNYASTLYGFTKKKSGWDCFRHYEIILSGTLPYFWNLENCPVNTMFSFPKELVLKGMALKGLPDPVELKRAYDAQKGIENFTIDKNVFNMSEYFSILQQVIAHTLAHSTYEPLGHYVLSKVQPFLGNDYPRVLFLARSSVGYMSGGLYGGLFNILKSNFSSIYEKVGMHKSTPVQDSFYGKGYSWAQTLEDSSEVTNRSLIEHRVRTKFYNVIVIVLEGYMECTLREFSNLYVDFAAYQNATNATVVVVDGTDIGGSCPDVQANPLKPHLGFLREEDNINRFYPEVLFFSPRLLALLLANPRIANQKDSKATSEALVAVWNKYSSFSQVAFLRQSLPTTVAFHHFALTQFCVQTTPSVGTHYFSVITWRDRSPMGLMRYTPLHSSFHYSLAEYLKKQGERISGMHYAQEIIYPLEMLVRSPMNASQFRLHWNNLFGYDPLIIAADVTVTITALKSDAVSLELLSLAISDLTNFV